MHMHAGPQAKRLARLRGTPFGARHHLTWLVQHRICGMTCEEIADRHAERDPQLKSPPTGDAVSKAIRRTAVALQLV